MAHWAEIDENNIVIRVVVGDNDDPNGDEGYQWLIDNTHSLGGTPFRKNYAMKGFTYDEQRDAFIPPMPTQTHSALGKPLVWEIDEGTCQWVKRVIES